MIATTLASRSTALAFPKVRTTSPARPSAMFASRTRSRNSVCCTRALRRAGSTPGSSGARWRRRGSAVVSSMTSSSIPAISARSANASLPIARHRTLWCGPPARSHASAAVAKSGFGFHNARATGRRGRASSGSTSSTSFSTSRKRSPRSSIAATTAGPGAAVKTSRTGSCLAADRERVDLARRPFRGDRGADLEHVRAEHLRAGRRQVVGVVLHERRAAGRPVAHHLHDADERGRLPVAFGAEPVAVGHQPLDGDPGKLLQAVRGPRRCR